MSRTYTDHLSSGAQLLALCPLIAVSDTVVNALGLGLAILVIVPLSAAAMTLIRGMVNEDIALAASVLLVAGIVACAELLMRAWFHDLRESLGVFLPLVVSNVIIVEHLRAHHTQRGAAVWHSFRIALVIAATLLVLGLARELVGRGSLLHGAGAMLGAWATGFEAKVFPVNMGFLLAMLPPGAFISLGLALAARNWITKKHRS